MTTPAMRIVSAAVVLVSVGAVVGCGSDREQSVEAVADDFYSAVAAHDGRAGCALLAPKTRSELEQSEGKECAAALFAEDLPDVRDVTDVHVFGTMAQVGYVGETVFLSRFESGWRVMAAACTPQPIGPYDCKLKGA